MEKGKGKRLNKYEKEAVILFILSFIIMLLSLCPGGIAEATGLLQGIGTGLMSGVVLLFVTGHKTADEKRINKYYNTINDSCWALIHISESYGELYHSTYHDKKEKMDFDDYFGIIKNNFNEYERAYDKIRDIDFDLIEDINIGQQLEQFKYELNHQLNDIDNTIKHIISGDKDTLDKLRNTFYDIQHNAYTVRSSCNKLWKKLSDKKEIIDNSWI